MARGCALLVLGSLAAGCSSSASRFSDGLDGVFTGSTDNQRQIIAAEPQPFPADQPAVKPAPVDGTYTGSVSRAALEPPAPKPAPVATASLPPASAAPAETLRAPEPASAARAEPENPAEPVRTTAKADRVARPAAPAEADGWSRAGGTQITVKSGETVYNLSRRFGVPADVIVKLNGLPDGSSLQAGQQVVIPTYVYSNGTPVSAPDSDQQVADARSSTGTRYDVPAGKVPLPSSAPKDKVAVLPAQPKVKESEPAVEQATAEAARPKPEPKAVTGEGGAGLYKVAEGDSLSRIARKTGVPVAALKEANGLKDGVIRVGQTLKVPAGSATVAAAKPVDKMTTGTAKATEAVEVAAYTPPVKQARKVIEEAEQNAAPAPDATGIGRMRWPVRGKVISGYSRGSGQDGIDIAVPEGTPVKAAENGVVIYAGDGLKEFGKTVLVRHENGLVTVYGHASELKVQRGDQVKRGQEIAASGMTGNAGAPKLHFEVRKDSAPVDPSTFLE